MKNLKRALSLLLSLMLVLGAISVGGVSAAAEDSVYMISSYSDLMAFASLVNSGNTSACAKLMNDIVATGYNDWTPIGYYESDIDNCPFTGTFDGDGYVITGLSTPADYNSNYAGLFGYVGSKTEGGVTIKGIVKNVGLEGINITGKDDVGGVVGLNDGGTVSHCYSTGSVKGSGMDTGGVVGYNIRNGRVINCYSTGDVTGSDNFTGGVVGFNSEGEVNSCYSAGNVSGRSYTGGVVGYNSEGEVNSCYSAGNVSGRSYTSGVVGYNIRNGRVINCYSTGNVSGSVSYTGGVAGYNTGNGRVTNCYSAGSVSGSRYTGGVAGYNTDNSEVTNCYSAGSVSGSSYIGGVVGKNSSESTITNCYYDKSVCGNIGAVSSADDASNVKGLTTAQMTGENALSNMTGFSDTDWLTKADEVDEDGGYIWFYPHLKGFNLKADGTPETDTSQILSSNWPAKAEVSVTLSEYSFDYDGELHMPTVTSVTVGGKTFEPDTDYTVSYHKKTGEDWSTDTVPPVNAGDYKAVVTFTDTGHDQIEKEFTINPKSLTGAIVILSQNTAEYTGGEITPNVTVKDGEKVLSKNTDYIVSYGNNINASENAKVTVTGKGNYKDSVEEMFTISPASVTLTANSRNTDVYDGTEKTVTGFTSSVSGLTFEGVTASGSGTNAGNYAVSFSGVTINETKDTTGNYVVTATENGTLTINPAAPGTSAAAEDIDYGQTAVVTFTVPADAKGKVTFTLDEAESGVTKDIENGQAVCEFENLTIGSHKVECVYTGDSNYESGDAVIANFEVKSIDCALTINYVYAEGGEAATTHTENVEIFTGYSVTSPEITGYTPDIATVEGTMGDEDMNGKTVTVTYTANTYKVTYVVDGEKLTEMDATFGQSVPRPRTPQREGYTFAWVDEIPETMPAQDVTINGKFTVIEYTATFVDENGETVEKVTFTVEDESITEPEVPEKAGYAGEWEEYTLGTSDITIKPVYANITSVQIENYEENSETGYKEDKTFTVKAEDLPEGAEIHWFVNGEDVGTGESYTVEDPTDDYNIYAEVIDKDGNTLDTTKVQSVKVRNGFFDRLKAFFSELIEKILGKAIADLLSSVC